LTKHNRTFNSNTFSNSLQRHHPDHVQLTDHVFRASFIAYLLPQYIGNISARFPYKTLPAITEYSFTNQGNCEQISFISKHCWDNSSGPFSHAVGNVESGNGSTAM